MLTVARIGRERLSRRGLFNPLRVGGYGRWRSMGLRPWLLILDPCRGLWELGRRTMRSCGARCSVAGLLCGPLRPRRLCVGMVSRFGHIRHMRPQKSLPGRPCCEKANHEQDAHNTSGAARDQALVFHPDIQSGHRVDPVNPFRKISVPPLPKSGCGICLAQRRKAANRIRESYFLRILAASRENLCFFLLRAFEWS